MSAAVVLLALVTAEWVGELWLARRNTAALLARGAYEAAPRHYPLIVALHALWLAGLWTLGRHHALHPVWFGLFIGLQVLRLWVLVTLGRRWTTRILVLPEERLVTAGPYRFFKHPNYLVVVGEIAVLPLALGLPWFALAFSVANGALLRNRMRAEDAALHRWRVAPRG